MPYFYNEESNNGTIAFKDFMTVNRAALLALMEWNNYGLHDVLLIATPELKEKALTLLTQNYGKFQVGDILDEISSDVATNFPLLMQSLSIASSMTYQSVSRTDMEHEKRTVIEMGQDSNNQTAKNNSQRDMKNTNNLLENNSTSGKLNNTGTVGTVETSDRHETNILDGDNSSITPTTGSKNVAITHSMPEQSIDGVSEDFSRDSQGTPNMNAATAQAASENFSTINQFQNTQKIDQLQITNNNINNNNTRTDNTLQVTDNASQTQSINDTTGKDIVLEVNTMEGINQTQHSSTDEVNRELANKQYPFEISKFLENIDNVKSFTNWINAFSWLCGVI